MKFKHAAAFLLSLAPLLVSAADTGIGSLPLLPSVYVKVVNLPAGSASFSDSFDFSLPASATDVSASVSALDFGNVLSVDTLQLALYDAGGTLLATSPAGKYATVSGFGLAAGAGYRYTVTGQALGSQGGMYSFVAAAAVPEPRSAALLLAGFLVVAFIARRNGR
jgi:hypothetical protein